MILTVGTERLYGNADWEIPFLKIDFEITYLISLKY